MHRFNFEGVVSGDGECCCVIVDQETFRRLEGEEAYQAELSYRHSSGETSPWRVYPGTIFEKALGQSAYDKRVRFLVTVESLPPEAALGLRRIASLDRHRHNLRIAIVDVCRLFIPHVDYTEDELPIRWWQIPHHYQALPQVGHHIFFGGLLLEIRQVVDVHPQQVIEVLTEIRTKESEATVQKWLRFNCQPAKEPSWVLAKHQPVEE